MNSFSRLVQEGADWRTVSDVIWAWLLTSGLRVVLILVLAWGLLRAVRSLVNRFEQHVEAKSGPGAFEHAKRTKTLTDLLKNISSLAIIVIAALTVLQELQVNIMPILTGAGILGLAVGFGAQTLVKDVISGFFLILENQVRVGDVVRINGTGGMVEAINLRTIVLRDQAGAVHVFPCGGVTTIANMSKDYSYALLDVSVPQKHDIDDVLTILEKTADAMREVPEYGAQILAPLDVIGVESISPTTVTIRVRLRTLPLRQWDIASEYRRRLKKSFEASEIIPAVTGMARQ